MTGNRHTGFPHDGDTEVEVHLVDAETGAEAPAAGPEETDQERLQREAKRAYQESGGVTGGAAQGGTGADVGVPPSAPLLAGTAQGAESAGPLQAGAPTATAPARAQSHGEAPPSAVSAGAGLPGAGGPRGAVAGTAEEWAQRFFSVEAERNEYLDSLRRVQADFENYRKRVMRQESEVSGRAAEKIVEKLLPVLDTVDLARRHSAGTEPPGDSVNMIAASLAEVLSREGLERIEPEGESFDPSEHEAVAHEPHGDDDDHGGTPEVVEVMRAGYRWKGRVMRPAMVRVRG